MADASIVAFIRNAQSKRYSRADIEAALRNKGWQPNQITEAFAEVSLGAPATPIGTTTAAGTAASKGLSAGTIIAFVVTGLVVITAVVVALILLGGPECESNVDCGDLQICTDQTCVDVQCILNTDCASGFQCTNNRCIAIPTVVPTTLEPSVECQEDRDCEDLEICLSGQCLPVDCKADSDCDSGEVCETNICVVSPVPIEEEQIITQETITNNIELTDFTRTSLSDTEAVYSFTGTNLGDDIVFTDLSVSCSLADELGVEIDSQEVIIFDDLNGISVLSGETFTGECALDSSSIATLNVDTTVLMTVTADSTNAVTESNEDDNVLILSDLWTAAEFITPECTFNSDCEILYGAGYTCEVDTCEFTDSTAVSCTDNLDCTTGYACALSGFCSEDLNLDGVADEDEAADIDTDIPPPPPEEEDDGLAGIPVISCVDDTACTASGLVCNEGIGECVECTLLKEQNCGTLHCKLVGNECIESCNTDLDCKEPNVCNQLTGDCIEPTGEPLGPNECNNQIDDDSDGQIDIGQCDFTASTAPLAGEGVVFCTAFNLNTPALCKSTCQGVLFGGVYFEGDQECFDANDNTEDFAEPLATCQNGIDDDFDGRQDLGICTTPDGILTCIDYGHTDQLACKNACESFLIGGIYSKGDPDCITDKSEEVPGGPAAAPTLELKGDSIGIKILKFILFVDPNPIGDYFE